MTQRAIIKEADAKRLARVAKAEGVSVSVEIDGYKVAFSPISTAIHSQEGVDQREEIDL